MYKIGFKILLEIQFSIEDNKSQIDMNLSEGSI